MGLLTPGYWHDTFHAKDFWHDTFWLDYGVEVNPSTYDVVSLKTVLDLTESVTSELLMAASIKSELFLGTTLTTVIN